MSHREGGRRRAGAGSQRVLGWRFDFILSTEDCNQGSGMTWIMYLKGHFGCIIGK